MKSRPVKSHIPETVKPIDKIFDRNKKINKYEKEMQKNGRASKEK